MKRSGEPAHLGYALGMGAARGALAAAVYCLAFIVWSYVDQRQHGFEGYFDGPGSLTDSLGTGVRMLLVLLALAVPAGLVLGALLGACALPLARKLAPAWAAAASASPVVVGTLLVAPWPLADEMHGTGEHLMFWLLPAVLLGLAVAWHAGRLSGRSR